MREIFDEYIENSFGVSEPSEFKISLFEYNYYKYFPVDHSVNVLDIGIGCGEMLTCMKKWKFANYQGIDISPSTVKFCNNLDLHCHIVNNTTHWLREHQDTFRVITVLDVLEHFNKNEIIPFLTAVRNALVDEGIAIIQVPNLQSPDSCLHRYNDITHEIGFVEHSLQQVLLASKFKEYEFHGFEECIIKDIRHKYRRFVRQMYWSIVRYRRLITNNLNPKILHPVFYVVAQK